LRAYKDEIPQTTFEDLVLDFCDFFQADNDNFNSEKFEHACFDATNELYEKVGA
jgi:hypothetical protein